MKNMKQCKVIMLPTNNQYKLTPEQKSESITILESGLGFGYQNGRHQHLYLVSNDEIKEGDWFIDTETKLLHQALKSTDLTFLNHHTKKHLYLKVIATTDSLLINDDGSGMGIKLPQIPQSFIQAYVREQGKIDEVMVEIEDDRDKYIGPSYPLYELKIKLRPDNTVIIHPCRTYTRVEVIKLIKSLRKSPVIYHHELLERDILVYTWSFIDFDKWIEENL